MKKKYGMWCKYLNMLTLHGPLELLSYVLSTIKKRMFFCLRARSRQVILQQARLRCSHSNSTAFFVEKTGTPPPFFCSHQKNRFVFDGSRTVIIADHKSKDKIFSYVLYSCKAFKKLGWRVVLVTTAQDVSFLDDPFEPDCIITASKPGTSCAFWYEAFFQIPTLQACCEVVLTHTELFSPVGSYAFMHNTMQKVSCDFWGAYTKVNDQAMLEEDYLVLRSSALQHKFFMAVFGDAASKETATLQFDSLCLGLQGKGLRAAVFCPAPNTIFQDSVTEYIEEYRLEAGVPFVPHSFLINRQSTVKKSWAERICQSAYPTKLIEEYFLQTEQDYSAAHTDGKVYGVFPPDVCALQYPVKLPAPSPMGFSLPAAIALHCHYPHLLSEMTFYLQNIPKEFHVLVTTDSTKKQKEIQLFFQKLEFEHTEIYITPNCGWDIAPFLLGLGELLRHYTIVLKIHAKQSPQYRSEAIEEWRNHLYGSLMGSPERVSQVMTFFEQNAQVGILAPSRPLSQVGISQTINHKYMCMLLKQYDINLPRDAAIDFPAGSMFWLRPQVLKPWLSLNLQYADFGLTNSRVRDGSLAHAIERLFFFGCGLERLQWGRLA